MAFALTTAQQAVVDSRGGGLLVSAAAGSGKTRVLVERLLCRVETEGLDIDRFLVITYTKAAAAELRGRIVEELSQRLASNPADGHLRRQATLVYKAQISTVHAFCAQLLRECGHLLDVNPDFRLCDETETDTLMGNALNDVLDRRYETIIEGDDFAQLVDTMSAGRDDAKLMEIVLDIRNRVQSHPNPNAWLDEQEKPFKLDGVTEAGQTPWGRLLLEDGIRQVDYWQGRMAAALALCDGDDTLTANYSASISATLDGLEAFLMGAKSGWDEAAAALPILFPRIGSKKVLDCPELAEQIKGARAACKKRMEKLAEWFVDGSEALLADVQAVYPAVRGLFALVKDFERAYTAEKERKGLLDFADLEHLAVQLLVAEDGEPTSLARQWSIRFDEIMVDEYQDTNEVQNTIFTALSQSGRNLFMVGDVKQSVYRFRLADPTIFLGKYKSFIPHDQAKDGEPRRIILSQNFRSRPQVLEGANYVFRSIMSSAFGEMDYTESEALYPGATYPQGDEGRYAVELDVLDCSGGEREEDEEDTGKTARDLLEARFVAKRLRTLLDEGFPVSDGGGGTRPMRPADGVVLLRSPGTVLHHYARALGERDIPWEADGGGDFFAATESAVALSLLQIVDNPRQDVPLISVLRSPLYAFTADRLANLRANAPGLDIYAAMEQDAGADCASFLEELADLRHQAGDRSCHQLIWHIYDRTNILGIFGAMDEGELRQSNLLLLAEVARRFEGAGHRGLFGFLSHLQRLRARGGRLATPSPSREGGGVRIMSIHKSKGLEFPVVFLCGLARKLNREDMNRPILFHPKLGVGPKRLDLERMIEYPTLARRAVARQLEQEMMAEELRLLYVAMTRAREKLILCCALAGGGSALGKLCPEASSPVDPQVLLGCQSVGQWLLLPVLARPEAQVLRDAGEAQVCVPVVDFGPAWSLCFVDGAQFEGAPASTSPRQQPVVQAAQTMGDGLAQRLGWKYPYHLDVSVPSKLTATQLKGRGLDEETVQEAPRPPKPLHFERPQFAGEHLGLTPAQKGTALHLVMQYINFEKTGSEQEVQREIDRLVRQQFLTPQQGEAVEAERIALFFASPLGRELKASTSLRREFKFSILGAAGVYYPHAGAEEQVLLQGVVDCFFETEEGITVVDFKTDRVGGDRVRQRAEDYRPQLEAYSRALGEITGKPVVRRALWFFFANCGIDL